MGTLHPLIVHFPIALVITAAVAESIGAATGDARWRATALVNVRAGALFAVAAAVAGWQLASSPHGGTTPLLEWHRWLGLIAAAATMLAAVTTGQRSRERRIYRIALFAAAALVAAAAHVGGVLVWGADFLRL